MAVHKILICCDFFEEFEFNWTKYSKKVLDQIWSKNSNLKHWSSFQSALKEHFLTVSKRKKLNHLQGPTKLIKIFISSTSEINPRPRGWIIKITSYSGTILSSVTRNIKFIKILLHIVVLPPHEWLLFLAGIILFHNCSILNVKFFLISDIFFCFLFIIIFILSHVAAILVVLPTLILMHTLPIVIHLFIHYKEQNEISTTTQEKRSKTSHRKCFK